jgi:SAM-dependent methyltransferase
MSREAAFDYIVPRIPRDSAVLDVGAGESPFANQILEKACKIVAVDHDLERLRRGWEHSGRRIEIVKADVRHVVLPERRFDVAIAIYSLQHMIGFEPAIWAKIRTCLRNGGIFLGTARYWLDSPKHEGARGDPLMSQDENTIRVLAGFTNFEIIDLQLYSYDGPAWARTQNRQSANAVGFQLRAISL